MTFQVDTTIPAPPTLSDASNVSIVNGYVNAANDTAAQVLTGTAGAGDTINVYVKGSTTPELANDTAAQALTGTAAAGDTINVYLNGSTTPAFTTMADPSPATGA